MAGWSICSASSQVECIIRGRAKNKQYSRVAQQGPVKKKTKPFSEIVELFKIKQALTEVKIRQLMAGGTRKRQAPRRRNKDSAIVQRTLITTPS